MLCILASISASGTHIASCDFISSVLYLALRCATFRTLILIQNAPPKHLSEAEVPYKGANMLSSPASHHLSADPNGPMHHDNARFWRSAAWITHH